MSWVPFFVFLLFRAIAIVFIAGWGELATAIIVCLCIGAVLESASSMLLDNIYKQGLKQFMYYSGIALQIVPLIVASASYLSMREDQLNFMCGMALGLMSLMITIGWYANGFEGVASVGFYYGGSLLLYGIEAIIYAITDSYHTMIIVNFVLTGLGVLAIILGRIFIGDNLE